MRKGLAFVAIFILCLTVPLYAAGRIVLPDWVQSQIKANLPDGAEFKVSQTKRNLDLSFVYEDAYFKYLDHKLIFSKLTFHPRLSVFSPLILTSDKIKLVSSGNTVNLEDVLLKIMPTDLALTELKLEGSALKINNQDLIMISNLKFLISEIKKSNLKVSLSADKAELIADFPLGIMGFNFNLVKTDIEFSDIPKVLFTAEKARYDLNLLGAPSTDRIIFSNNVQSSFQLNKKNVLEMPIEYSSGKVSSSLGEVAEDFKLFATGVWEEKSVNCDLKQFLFSGANACGKMVHVSDFNLSLSDNMGIFEVEGYGKCVAKGSGCPQVIEAEIKSTNTAQIFTNLMRTNVINPLVSGVVLGALLSSPATASSYFDHTVNFKLRGSNVYLNDKPLLN